MSAPWLVLAAAVGLAPATPAAGLVPAGPAAAPAVAGSLPGSPGSTEPTPPDRPSSPAPALPDPDRPASVQEGDPPCPRAPAGQLLPSTRLGEDVYNALTDGQPGPPGRPEVQLDVAASEGGNLQAAAQIQHTPACGWLWDDMTLELTSPGVRLAGDPGTADAVTLGWQQRWALLGDGRLAVGTLLEVLVPTGAADGGATRLTGVLAAAVAEDDAAFLNVVLASPDGPAGGSLGVLAGYKLRDEGWALVAEGLYRDTEERALGLGVQLPVGWLTLGPGVRVRWGPSGSGPRLTAGITLLASP